jgi:hypothetical protein
MMRTFLPGGALNSVETLKAIRRLGLAPIPLSCFLIATLQPIVVRHTAGTKLDPGFCALLFISLVLFKVLLGLVLLGVACKQRASEMTKDAASPMDEELANLASQPADPLQQPRIRRRSGIDRDKDKGR